MIRRQPGPPRERISVRWIAAGLTVALIAAFAGWFAARQIGTPPKATPATEKTLTAGAVRLRVSTDWARVARPPDVPGLGHAPAWAPYAALSTTVSVAIVPADHPSLLPTTLVDQAKGGLPAPEAAKVVGLAARAYRGVRSGTATLDVYAIPTTRGILTLVCRAPNGGPEAPAWCLNGLDQITVEGASAIKPDASTAFRLKAPAVLATLNQRRVEERTALRRAHTPPGQAKVALELWRVHRDTAASLATLAPAGSDYAKLVSAIRDAGTAYRGLAASADRRSKRSWLRARSRVSRAEKALQAALVATS